MEQVKLILVPADEAAAAPAAEGGEKKGFDPVIAEKIKARAFAEFAHRYGVEELLDCLERNERAGIVYHREGIMGDYDEFDDLDELMAFIRTGRREKTI